MLMSAEGATSRSGGYGGPPPGNFEINRAIWCNLVQSGHEIDIKLCQNFDQSRKNHASEPLWCHTTYSFTFKTANDGNWSLTSYMIIQNLWLWSHVTRIATRHPIPLSEFYHNVVCVAFAFMWSKLTAIWLQVNMCYGFSGCLFVRPIPQKIDARAMILSN